MRSRCRGGVAEKPSERSWIGGRQGSQDGCFIASDARLIQKRRDETQQRMSAPGSTGASRLYVPDLEI
jgi:hypothetical protein